MYKINVKEVIMNHEVLTNELDEITKSLIEKMETEINEKDKKLSSYVTGLCRQRKI
jgi:mRNA-degrading endonuclease YafQ of YafQ-DinJ toxin-antitoxin module